MLKMKQVLILMISAGLLAGVALPSYAEDAPTTDTTTISKSALEKPTKDSDKKHGKIAYNNLTSNFAYTGNGSTSTETSPWKGVAGFLVGSGPKYPGSNESMGQAGLNFNMSYNNRFFFTSGQGLGVNIINTAPWTVGTSVTYAYGNQRANEFNGLQSAKAAFLGTVFANYTVSLYNFGISAYKTIGQLGGAGYYQASATRAVPLTKQLVVNLIVSTQYDDARYLQSLYGVTPTESVASGLPTYSTHAGWDNVSYGITPMYTINKHWIVVGSVVGISYVDQVGISPVIKRNQNYAVAVGVLYNLF